MKDATVRNLDYQLKIIHTTTEDALILNTDGTIGGDIVASNVTREYDLTANTTGIKYDITAKVSKSTTFGSDNFEIMIYNLDKDLLHKINKPRLILAPAATVKLSIKGNADNAYYEIINKEAVEIQSIKQDGITIQTKIYGYSGSSSLNAYSNVNFKDSTLMDVAKKLANDAGLSFENRVTSSNSVNGDKMDFIFGNSTISQHLSKLNQGAVSNNINMFVDNDAIVALENTQYRKKHIVKEYNLRSTPVFASNIISLSMFLYPAINVGDLIEINDELNKDVAGTYTVINCEHTFDYFKKGGTSGKTNVDLLAF